MGKYTIEEFLDIGVKKGYITDEQIDQFVTNKPENNKPVDISHTDWVELGINNSWKMPISEDVKQKISNSKRGKIWIKNIEIKESRLIHPDEYTDGLINQGWIKGKLSVSDLK